MISRLDSFFFFFQAEDGIRDIGVTGVQTCALPICDIFQVNLSHRLEGDWDGAAWPLYERLRTASPVSYGAYLDLGDVKVLSASPERFLKPDGRWIETRPIRGTRPRGVTSDEDRMLGAELLTSEKDRAENLMIVDLLRNDIGKVSCIGSVGVPKLFDLERHASVWHLVSTVRGRSEEHTSELQSRQYLVCRLLLEKKKKTTYRHTCVLLIQ